MRQLYLILFTATFVVACNSPETPQAGAAESSFFALEQIETAKVLRDRALAGSGAYELLQDLVNTAPNRLAGGPDDLKAVAWAEETFRSLGFDKVWTEPVVLPGWARVSATAHLVGHEDQAFNIVSLGKSASTPLSGVTAPLAHFRTYEDLVEADPSEVAGRIVFISNRMARMKAGAGYDPAVVARSRGHLAVAEKNGLALLIRSIGTDDSDYPHTGAMSFGEEDDNSHLFRPATNEQAWAVQYGKKTVAAAALSNRDADELQEMVEAGEEIVMFVDVQNKNLGDITTYNIIGEITGASRPDEIVITGGHIDAWDLGTGAMDDGMGVVTTATAVGLIANLETRPARTIRMVAFGAEELGVYGGKAYAELHHGEDHVFGSELDYGLGRPIALVPIVSEAALPVMREIHTVLEPLGMEWDTSMQGFLGADLTPLAKHGLSGAFVWVDTDRYFDHHHSASDTMDLINPTDLDYTTAAYAALLYLVAEYEGRFD